MNACGGSRTFAFGTVGSRVQKWTAKPRSKGRGVSGVPLCDDGAVTVKTRCASLVQSDFAWVTE